MLESLGFIFSASNTTVPFPELFPSSERRFQGVPGSCSVGTVKERQMTAGVRFSGCDWNLLVVLVTSRTSPYRKSQCVNK